MLKESGDSVFHQVDLQKGFRHSDAWAYKSECGDCQQNHQRRFEVLSCWME
jgi:arginyl-tRNA--protein-N-Asp/Glu arginylyltransferase